MTRRDPGVMEPIVDTDVFCELICDGVHVHPTLVRLLRRLVGRDRGLVELARVASTNAARLLGEDHRIGRIRPGQATRPTWPTSSSTTGPARWA